jgi:hypothetical protein
MTGKLVANSIIFPAQKNYLSEVGPSLTLQLRPSTLHDALGHDIVQAAALSNVPHKEDARDTPIVTQASAVMRTR